MDNLTDARCDMRMDLTTVFVALDVSMQLGNHSKGCIRPHGSVVSSIESELRVSDSAHRRTLMPLETG